MIKNIIFDIGNVLAAFRWKEFLEDKGFDQDMVKRIAKASILSPFWQEFDRGEWDKDKLMEEFVRMDPEIEKELHTAYDNVTGIVSRLDYAIPWIMELKAAGFGVYYLSNFSYKAHVDCADALDFIPCTDGGILSYQDRVVKPDPAIYRLLLSRYGLKARECVFLDDTLVNVEAARELGFYGIHFIDRQQAVKELESLGVVKK